jgi:hypothetical protein
MTHPETQKLITAVEDLTGDRGSVDTIDEWWHRRGKG